MKRPSFQFYPADWRNNAKLRRCSEAARGAWMDVLCLLHDGDEYGLCRWPMQDLARAAGVPIKLLRELVDKGVLKGADGCHGAYVYTPRHAGRAGDPVVLVAEGSGPCWYSSRMVRDEWVRLRRGGETQFTSTIQPPKPEPKNPPKPPIGDRVGDGPTSTSSPTVRVSEEANASSSSPEATQKTGSTPTIPCPYNTIVDAYHEGLPSWPKVRLRDGPLWNDRQKAMRTLWGWVLSSRRADGSRRAETGDQAIRWFRDYFARALENDFLMGRTPRGEQHRGWKADFDFLLTKKGLKQVIEKTEAAA